MEGFHDEVRTLYAQKAKFLLVSFLLKSLQTEKKTIPNMADFGEVTRD